MKTNKDALNQRLLDRNLISQEQFKEMKSYQSLGIFSLHNELLFLLYLSVLLFTSGVGTLIYKNIDTIGHVAILASIFILTVVCFYFSFKKSPGFSKESTDFENPVYNYLVLLGTILSCTFVGYLQFQYKAFGADFSLATLVCALIGFSSAYYFDNKSALSIGITALGTAVGISITPKSVLTANVFTDSSLIYSGLALGILLLLWTKYSNQINLKKHFALVFYTFALNLIAICCIAGLFKDYWFFYLIPLAASSFYFYKKSYQIRSFFIFVFTVLYAYIGLNITLVKTLSDFNSPIISTLIVLLLPFYVVGSILLFISLVKHFNKAAHDSIR